MSVAAWNEAKQIIGAERVTLGPQASQQWLRAPDHLAMVLARYRAAAALIGNAPSVLEIGCGEGIGAGILAAGRAWYCGVDRDASSVETAITTMPDGLRWRFLTADVLTLDGWAAGPYSATVSLDVIEHIPAEREAAFMRAMTQPLRRYGLAVIGTPNAVFDHLASPQSKAGHCNTYTHDRLYALMARHFRLVQSVGLQDTSLHTGHPEARHYLLMCGVSPK